MIFRIAHQDTLGLMQFMRLALAEINRASTDSLLQERALHWRYRLDQFRAQLVELEESFNQFATFVDSRSGLQAAQTVFGLEDEPVEYLRADALRQISSLYRNLEQAYTSLTSKVQISDSHRSIAEAKTVTRLTELAFLFIPLSFATSIFGMQIVDGSTPVSTYISVAIALTALAYILRLFIHRTTSYRMAKVTTVKNSIRSFARLRPGSRISTVLAIKWLLHKIRKQFNRPYGHFVLSLVSLLVLAIPLSVLWTRPLDSGIKITVSCLLLLIPIGILGYPFLSELTLNSQRVRLAGSVASTHVDSLSVE